MKSDRGYVDLVISKMFLQLLIVTEDIFGERPSDLADTLHLQTQSIFIPDMVQI